MMQKCLIVKACIIIPFSVQNNHFINSYREIKKNLSIRFRMEELIIKRGGGKPIDQIDNLSLCIYHTDASQFIICINQNYIKFFIVKFKPVNSLWLLTTLYMYSYYFRSKNIMLSTYVCSVEGTSITDGVYTKLLVYWHVEYFIIIHS